jgi:hypothetical protein
MKKAGLFFVVLLLGTVLFAQNSPVPAGLEWEIVDGRSVTITRYTGGATTLNIPGQIEGLPVTFIGINAFKTYLRLTSVTLPSSVTSIAVLAFSYCTSLTSVTISSSVTSIGDRAFEGCTSLTGITVDSNNPVYASVDGVLFDKSMRTIILYPQGKQAETYAIPSSVTSIGNGAFAWCGSLKNVTIPVLVTAIGDLAFNVCSSLTSLTIPASVTAIGDNAFARCNSMTGITVDSSNPVYASVDGVLFDKAVQTIIAYPVGKRAVNYVIPS